MSARPLKKALHLAAAAAFILASAGCSSNPPCETDLALVDAARSAATASETKLADAKRQQAELEKQVEAETARKAELERKKAELQAKIAELQK
jgi:septal ring factor EnvC (AmiA/AmiB activator)